MHFKAKKIIFESHATSTDNEKAVASGWLDPPLSEKGRVQAKELGGRYRKETLSAIYVSDLCRSYETALIAFNDRHIPLFKDFRLREWNYGQYNGQPASEVDSLKIKHLHLPFPKGESLEQVLARFLSFQKEHLEKAEDSILIIGHRATYYALEFYLRKVALENLVSIPWKWQPGWQYLL